jgi:tight adherence protein B
MNASVAPVVAGLAVVIGALATRAAGGRAHHNRATQRLVGLLTHGHTQAEQRDRLRSRWSEPPAWLVTLVDELEAPLHVAYVWRWWRVAAGVAVVIGGLAAGPVAAVIAVALVVGAPLGASAVWRSRQSAAYDATLATALDAMARSVRSGGSLASAVGESGGAVRGAVASDLHRVAALVDRGEQLSAALSQWAGRRPRAAVRLAVGALVLAAESGGPPARVIEEVAGAVRIRLQVEAEARALAAQARLSALVVGLAPVGFLALTSATDPRNAHMLFATPIGVSCLVAGLSLDAVGALWMHRISESVVR